MTVNEYEKITLTAFQERCLESFWDKENSLIVAPSSAGKTFAVEKYILEFIDENFGKFLKAPKKMKIALIFPYKSIAIQEYNKLSSILYQRGLKSLICVGGVEISREDVALANL
ncbi:MAG: DEAD/DEAH box helicase, partial [Candidatus Heimdallarchaeaceae archaeon]